jgi:hypothetical protein
MSVAAKLKTPAGFVGVQLTQFTSQPDASTGDWQGSIRKYFDAAGCTAGKHAMQHAGSSTSAK